MAKNLCSRCFHSYVCEQFNEHRDSTAEYTRCHFYNDHFVDSDDVEVVVRCKDCLHSRELNKYEKQLYLSECVGCTYHSVSYQDSVMMGDDFCSYGERRDSDG